MNGTTPASTRPISYKPQLDGLRAFAVLAVWFDHWHIGEIGWMRFLPWGSVGVRLFFVLSGFLITGILIRARDEMESSGQGLLLTARQFYIRRFLRIFPIYYLVLFACAALSIGKVREIFWWHLTYTTNFYFAFHERLNDAGMHFWTLAVEEQFYLVWPWLILLMPSRHRVKAIVLMILSGPVLRVAWALAGKSAEAASVLPIGAIDCLATGSLLAAIGPAKSKELCRTLLWIGLPAFVALMVVRARTEDHSIWLTMTPLAMSMVFAWVIHGASHGFTGVVAKVLEFPVITYLGKISYGLYVYHGMMRPIAWKFGLRPTNNVWLDFLILGSLSIGVSIISWHLMEKPINDLKRYFDYAPKKKNAGEVVTGATI